MLNHVSKREPWPGTLEETKIELNCYFLWLYGVLCTEAITTGIVPLTHWPQLEVTKPISYFQLILQNSVYRLDITLLIHRHCHGLSAGKHVKFEWDPTDLTYTFAKLICP